MMNYGGQFVSVCPDKCALAQFIHTQCVFEREKERGNIKGKLMLSDITRPQLTADFPSLIHKPLTL